ncbi:unnamed protein product [Citrullus colocynthis]|uniref:Secreted protein n=1 Tax=Citrullus colocynthis TaxID=252529 RepID=A0ABP0Z9C8_9ROSI
MVKTILVRLHGAADSAARLTCKCTAVVRCSSSFCSCPSEQNPYWRRFISIHLQLFRGSERRCCNLLGFGEILVFF